MDRRVRVDRDERDGLELELLRPGEACCPGRRDVLRSQDVPQNRDELPDRQVHRQSRGVHQDRQDLLRDRLGRCGWDASGDERRVHLDVSRDHPDRQSHRDRCRDEDARRSDVEPYRGQQGEQCSWDAGRFAALRRDVPELRAPLEVLGLLQAQELLRRSRQRLLPAQAQMLALARRARE